MKQAAHLHLVPRLGMRGGVPPFPPKSSDHDAYCSEEKALQFISYRNGTSHMMRGFAVGSAVIGDSLCPLQPRHG